MAKNAETKQIETMVGNMDVERRLLDEVTLAGNSIAGFRAPIHAFDKDGDGFITFQDVVAEVENLFTTPRAHSSAVRSSAD